MYKELITLPWRLSLTALHLRNRINQLQLQSSCLHSTIPTCMISFERRFGVQGRSRPSRNSTGGSRRSGRITTIGRRPTWVGCPQVRWLSCSLATGSTRARSGSIPHSVCRTSRHRPSSSMRALHASRSATACAVWSDGTSSRQSRSAMEGVRVPHFTALQPIHPVQTGRTVSPRLRLWLARFG